MKLNDKWFKKKWVAYTIATCSAVILYMILSNLPIFFYGIKRFFAFLRPVIVGIIIAYIIDPLAVLLEKTVFKKVKRENTRRKLSVIIALLIIIALVTLLFVALIPQIVDSMTTFISNIGGYLESAEALLNEMEHNKAVGLFGFDMKKIYDIGEKIIGAISGYFSQNMDNVLNSSVSAGKGVADSVIAFILAIYLLFDKNRIITALAKLLRLIFKEKTCKNANEFFTRCNDIIIRYISFDIIDGIVVGIVNFLFMVIVGLPYSVLISVIVGVTNLAPTFGPIAGCIIACFVLVLVNPWYALWFLIFTLILQTIDGYILKPRLFGGSLGVSPLMILVSIVLGGRLFGVAGILLAIPFAAIIDFIFKDYLIKRLEEKRGSRYNM